MLLDARGGRELLTLIVNTLFDFVGAFAFYAGLCFIGWTFCRACYPETAGLSLEEVTQIFKDDFGIRAAERLRREKAELRADVDFYENWCVMNSAVFGAKGGSG